MKRLKLTAEPRKVLGKNVKKLRREGILPANVYGKDIKSQSLQLPQIEFNKVYSEAGETGVIDLTIGNDVIPVLIHNINKDYRREVIHADFYKVNLKEKVSAMIPIELVGEAGAVTEKIGLIMEITNEVEVEALPTDLPEKIEVNVEHLVNVDDQISVADLKAPNDVTILTDPNLIVVKIGELVSKEAQEQAAADEVAAAEASAESGAEGESANGEAKEGETAEAGKDANANNPQE